MKIVAAFSMLSAVLCGCAHNSPAPQTATAEVLNTDTNRSFYLSLVSAIIDGGKPSAALAFLDEYLTKYPKDKKALNLQAQAYLHSQNYERSKAAYLHLRTLGNNPSAETGLGQIYAAQNKWDKALHHFKAAANATPSDVKALNNLGYAALKARAYEKAFEALSRAYELRPEDTTIRNNLLLAAKYGGKAQALHPILAGLPHEERKAVEDLLNAWGEI